MRSKIASPLVAALVAATAALALSPQPAVPVTVEKRPPLSQVNPKLLAKELLTPKQYSCFTKLMGKESAWRPTAKNPASSARGIGQLLDGTYRSLGMRHSAHGVPQVVAALAYIGRKYGSAGPCGAWKHWQKHKWIRKDVMNAFDKQKPQVELPLDVAAWIELYRKTQGEIKALEEKLEQAKGKIQEMMGENEVGLLDGRVAVRWTKVTSTRLDIQKAKEILDPKIFGFLSRESTSRRFTLADPDEHS